MPNIFIIMGNGQTRKSATIRALTGVYNSRVRLVGTHRGVIKVFVKISSLQESKISPKKFINLVQRGNHQNVLLSIWISQGKKQPDGITYIQEFINAGWNINQIVVLGTDNVANLPQNIPKPNYISDSRSLPSNTIASQIRQWWQWL